VLLALIPIANIAVVLFTTGADNPSNDYLQYMGLIGNVLDGKYNWSNYIADTFYRTHSVALPVAFHILDAALFRFNMYVELAVGLMLAGLRLVFLSAALGRSLSGWRKIVLIPVLSFLIFSDSQMSVFAFGDAALTIQLSLLGFALGLWGLCCLQSDRWRALCMVAGGLIAAFSWGNGPVTWMIFLAALLLSQSTNRWMFAAWLSGFGVSLLPYIQALIVNPMVHHASSRNGTTVVSFLNLKFCLNLLGWPFTNNIATNVDGTRFAKIVGWAGLCFSAAILVLIAKLRQAKWWQLALPGILCLLHGTLSIWQISVFRGLLASWYTTVAMSFWIGLTGLVFLVLELVCTVKNGNASKNIVLAGGGCAGVYFFALTAAYLYTNTTFDDKTNFLYSRSPASAAVLRHYREAPLSASQYVFQWGGDYYGLLPLLAAPLEKHRLSVFAPRQTWTLQGDNAIGTVTCTGSDKSSCMTWSNGRSAQDLSPWWSYRHLNLIVPSSHTVAWKVTIPAEALSAELKTAAAPAESAAASGSGPLPAVLEVKPEDTSNYAVFRQTAVLSDSQWHPLTLPLGQYKGKTVTIDFSAIDKSNRPVVWQSPTIAIETTGNLTRN
jgi:hypothetical protein